MIARRRSVGWQTTLVALGGLVLLAGCLPEQRPGTVKTIDSTGRSGSASTSVSVSEAPEAQPAKSPAAKPSSSETEPGASYRPLGNVDIYHLLSLDVNEITTLTNQVNEGKPLPSQEILALYEQGKLARIGQTTRALRPFALNANRAKDFPEEAAFYKSNTFLDDPVIAAINGSGAAASYSPAQRRQTIQKGLLRILRYYSVQELNGAESKIKAGNVDPASGAPHNVDEAWAIYVGAERDGKYPYSIAATAQSREANFKRPGALDRPLQDAFARAQKAAANNDLEGFDRARADVISRFNAVFYLSAARELAEAAEHAQAGKADSAAVELVEGLGFYQTIQPSAAKTEPEADKIVIGVLQSEPTRLTDAQRDRALGALNKMADALALKTSDRLSPSDFQ